MAARTEYIEMVRKELEKDYDKVWVSSRVSDIIAYCELDELEETHRIHTEPIVADRGLIGFNLIGTRDNKYGQVCHTWPVSVILLDKGMN